jgi:hypothetical protein
MMVAQRVNSCFVTGHEDWLLNPVRSDEIGIVPTESSNADVVLVGAKFGIPSRYSWVSTQKLHVHSYNAALVRLNQPVEGRFGCCTPGGTGCPGC